MVLESVAAAHQAARPYAQCHTHTLLLQQVLSLFRGTLKKIHLAVNHNHSKLSDERTLQCGIP
jgi:hypothetical protein